MKFDKKFKPLFHTTRLILSGFAIVIILATLILMTPAASATGTWTPFIDALFTATTSVCVTGLVVVPTFSYWSLFGKIIILFMIQLGGLGVICIMMGFFILIRKKITLKERRLIQESYNLDQTRGMVMVVVRVFKATFFIEGIGALLYAIKFIPRFGLLKGLGYSIFHAVSAFCNAGIDLLGNDSLLMYQGDVFFNIVTMFLIVSGGLGFIVWWDILKVLGQIRRGELSKNKFFERLSLHSKLAITVTLLLIIGGAIIIFAFEYSNAKTIGNMTVSKKVLASLFESVTLRTAGFTTVSQAGFKDATFIVICILMLIGGSPMGTAGGIKTTTVAILLIEVMSVIKGKKDAEVFRRRIDQDNVKTAISVVFISLVTVMTAIMVLTFTENAPLKTLVFEAVSAIGTVGLSMNYTSLLTAPGKAIIILLMYMGRIGPITLAMAFSARRKARIDRDLPEKRIIIG